ncbi:hypothetical protein QCA50_015438 [Cerrena zonata]|uniref:Uncharacterized protein n=1 Tax=Cerrena zonata TaxID=2478898 RepID=A0AAW0FPZ8_9APHY
MIPAERPTNSLSTFTLSFTNSHSLLVDMFSLRISSFAIVAAVLFIGQAQAAPLLATDAVAACTAPNNANPNPNVGVSCQFSLNGAPTVTGSCVDQNGKLTCVKPAVQPVTTPIVKPAATPAVQTSAPRAFNDAPVIPPPPKVSPINPPPLPKPAPRAFPDPLNVPPPNPPKDAPIPPPNPPAPRALHDAPIPPPPHPSPIPPPKPAPRAFNDGPNTPPPNGPNNNINDAPPVPQPPNSNPPPPNPPNNDQPPKQPRKRFFSPAERF